MLERTPSLRWAAGLAAAGWIAAFGCRARAPEPAKGTVAAKPIADVEEIGWFRLDFGPLPADSLRAVPLADLPAHLRSLYRLRPDRRVLYAFAEVDRLLTGRRGNSTLSIRFEGGEWKLALEGEKIGSLPELPSLADWRRLLSTWTASRRKTGEASTDPEETTELRKWEADLESGPTARVLDALRGLNRLAVGHPRSPRLMRAAARGTIWLVLQTQDDLKIADPLEGHALALLAIAQNLAPGTLTGDEALLERQMGYETAAVETAHALAASDPVRLWVDSDSEALAKAAAAPDATARTQYLFLLDEARRGGPLRWLATFEKTDWASQPDVGSFHAVLALNDFVTNRFGPPAMMAAAWAAASKPLARTAGAPAVTPKTSEWSEVELKGFLIDQASQGPPAPESQTRIFEGSVNQLASGSDGPLIDRESVRSFYRANFYSGMHATARFLFDEFGSTDSAAEFANSLGDPAPGTAAELHAWMVHRVAIRRGLEKPQDEYQALKEWRHIGSLATMRVATYIVRNVASNGDPVRRKTIRSVFRQLDSRPMDLPFAWDAAWEIHDLRELEAAGRALLEAAPVMGRGDALRVLYWRRDKDAIRRVADDRRYRVSTRAAALSDLGLLGDPDAAFRRKRCLDLMKEEPEDPEVLDTCIGFHQDAHDLRGADETIRGWLARRPTQSHDLLWAHALARRAELMASEKRWDEAWKVIQPALETGKGEVLVDAAWILEERHRWDEALAMSQDTLQRYQDDYVSRVIAARVLWRQRKSVEAADWLTRPPAMPVWAWRGSVASSFARVFAKADPPDAQGALQVLRERRVDEESLMAIVKAVGEAGDHKLAFSLFGSLPAAHINVERNLIWAHDELAKIEGKDAAAAWLRQHASVPRYIPIAAYGIERYGLLWEPLADEATAKIEEVQLLRAASLIRAPCPDDAARQATLVAYFKARPQSWWTPMGLLLLGEAGPEPLFAMTKANDIANLGWLMGLRAAKEGRYEEASDWFGISVESGNQTVPTMVWSLRMLDRWRERDLFLSELARERAM